MIIISTFNYLFTKKIYTIYQLYKQLYVWCYIICTRKKKTYCNQSQLFFYGYDIPIYRYKKNPSQLQSIGIKNWRQQLYYKNKTKAKKVHHLISWNENNITIKKFWLFLCRYCYKFLSCAVLSACWMLIAESVFFI